MAGQTHIVTGATSGIGEVTARRLAERGARVLLCCRDVARANGVAREIERAGHQASVFELDLADLGSVRRCAQRLLDAPFSLDVLINNAGLAGAHGVTRQGFELTFGTNHLGHFLLTRLLLPKLLLSKPRQQPMCESLPARVINVSSLAHYKAKEIDFDAVRAPTRSRTGFAEYRVSKLANVLHACELSRRYGAVGLFACSLHPGVVASSIWREVPQPFRAIMKLFMVSNEQGAQTTLHVAGSPVALAHNGAYFDDSRPREPSPLARDRELAARLWEASELWTNP